jgi:hypothetical protein
MSATHFSVHPLFADDSLYGLACSSRQSIQAYFQAQARRRSFHRTRLAQGQSTNDSFRPEWVAQAGELPELLIFDSLDTQRPQPRPAGHVRPWMMAGLQPQGPTTRVFELKIDQVPEGKTCVAMILTQELLAQLGEGTRREIVSKALTRERLQSANVARLLACAPRFVGESQDGVFELRVDLDEECPYLDGGCVVVCVSP